MKVILKNCSLVFQSQDTSIVPISSITVKTISNAFIGSGRNPNFPVNILKSSNGTETVVLDVHNYVGKTISVSSTEAPGVAAYFFVFGNSTLVENINDELTPVGVGVDGEGAAQSLTDVTIPSGAYYCYVSNKDTLTGNIDNN